jgi:hypothetical protein
MKLGRGLSVIYWSLVLLAVSIIVTIFGGSLIDFELCLFGGFVAAWCNDE